MDKVRQARPTRASKAVITFEVHRGDAMGEPAYTVTVSMAGREGTFARSWGNFLVRMDQATYDDMTAWIEYTLWQCIAIESGTQQVMPLA